METKNRERKRSALLIRCSAEEAKKIRQAAKEDHRTLSAFILNIVMRHVEVRETLKRRRGI